MLRCNRLLVPVDFSPDSMAALKYAVALAKKLQGPQHVVVLYVVDEGLPGPLETSSLASEASAESARERRRVARERLEAFLEGVDPGAESMESAVVIGRPAFREICKYAAERGFDMIIMGTQGKGALRRLVLGSTTQDVQRHACCPVLTVRDPERWMEEGAD